MRQWQSHTKGFLINLVLHVRTICVPNGGGFSKLYLCSPVPQTGRKYHFIFHMWGAVFEETTCVSPGNIRILFCNIFFLFLTCLMEMILILSAGGKHAYSIMDLMLIKKKPPGRKWAGRFIHMLFSHSKNLFSSSLLKIKAFIKQSPSSWELKC